MYSNNLKYTGEFMPKVSVILPSLNVRKYIDETMRSVMNQTLDDIEIICVDAGSTDGTLEILEEFANKDSRIRIINSSRKSYGYQMNLGIKEARGEYVGIVETDDFVACEMYESLYEVAEEYDVDVVKSDFEVFSTLDNGERMFLYYSLKDRNKLKYNELYSNDLYINGLATVECYIWNAIYKKSFLEENGIVFNETPGASFQDFGFKYQVAYAARKMIALNKAFYRYRRDNCNSSTYSKRTAEYNLREAKFLLSVLDKWKVADRVYEAAAREILQFAVYPFVELCKWSEPADDTMDAMEEYHLMFQKFAKKDYIDENLVDWDLLVGFNMLCESAKLYFDYVKVISQLQAKKVHSLLSRIRAYERVIIYGCGKRGTACNVFLKNNHCKNIVAFCDGDDNKCGTEKQGLNILSVEEAVSKYNNALFIVTAAGAQKEIRDKLRELNVDDENILLYDLQTDPLFCTNCIVTDN